MTRKIHIYRERYSNTAHNAHLIRADALAQFALAATPRALALATAARSGLAGASATQTRGFAIGALSERLPHVISAVARRGTPGRCRHLFASCGIRFLTLGINVLGRSELPAFVVHRL